MAEMAEHPEIIPDSTPSKKAVEQLKEYLRKLRSDGFTTVTFDVEIVAPMFLGALFADTLGRVFTPASYAKSPEKTLEGYVDFFLRGIGVEKQAGTLRAS